MNKFKSFGIEPKSKCFKGHKISIDQILNTQIIVEDFRIEKSKYPGKHEWCLYLQIILNSVHYVVFSGSANLIEMIQKVEKKNFPFETTIVKKDKRHDFT